MKKRIQEFKQNLALVFDDNLHTKKWHNYLDYLIIGMIILSSVEIFLSTFDIDPRLRRVLLWIDIGCLIFFTIEVSLRIWVAPLINPKFKGIKGRIKYCFTFHGFIDMISTYPFYIQWLIPFPVAWMRVFRMSRTVRLFKLSRYMKSWKLLSDTVYEKRHELIISLQFLLIVTFILSLMLFFFEHEAQPDVYDNGFSSVAWSFAQYIGDPGGFGDTPPITTFGKIIACIVGLLGIAIVAVPAGILGSGFTEAIEHRRDDEVLNENRKKLRGVFRRLLDRPTRYQAVSFYKSLPDIQARTGMNENEVIDVVKKTPGFRIINLAATIPVEQQPNDRLAVEHFPINRSYGVCVDRGSKITIVASVSLADSIGGTFGFYLALMGGFNFISREMGRKIPYVSLYLLSQKEYIESEKEFLKDLTKLMNRKDSWSFDILPASGANEPEYDTQLHFGIGNPKGVESMEGVDLLVKDIPTYKKFYNTLSKELEEKFDISIDNGRYHATDNPKIWSRVLPIPKDANSVVVRMAWSAILWNDKRLLIAKTIADTINKIILGIENPEEVELLKTKDYGFEGYNIPDLKTIKDLED